jgi:hypothetical protein
MIEIPPKMRDKMDSSQPDDLILAKAAFAAAFAFLGKKVAVVIYEHIKSRKIEDSPDPENPEEET